MKYFADHSMFAAISNLQSTGASILSAMQLLGIVSAAIAFGIGAYHLIWGGVRGRQSSIVWFIGGAVGLVVLMGATAIAEYIDSQVIF
ncbi:hypothetical protein CEH05_18195 [Halobacillus halophilus]|uniref:Uncharacterized protein n=1 Tax=Halobacillus halophilus (strain ATCC 35676 / DSM 2266 / JCM 20832 / KCTC 3685 / LMG 17431 / NBRC 102448 / NCIMB 2269) TaxID=866895 RepID=I0JSC5_HALH3|nr:hypothetical protein [Halobacillus halophilus]ASF40983.1 hypothetical protein CEH05_18195 [Halobacillus halophilus]CCG47047.1 conserved hypothetical protein [Halobacillus halophilus DSM 2266]